MARIETIFYSYCVRHPLATGFLSSLDIASKHKTLLLLAVCVLLAHLLRDAPIQLLEGLELSRIPLLVTF